MYAQLGNIVFENRKGQYNGFFGFNDFSESTSVSYAEHKPLEGKPLLQATGLNLDELSLSMRLHVSFCNPTEELDKLKTCMDTFEVLPLLMGNGKKAGNFVITNLSSSVENADPEGNILSYLVSCTLKEYVTPDRLQELQDAARQRAAAVGDKKPVAGKKKNSNTCAQSISSIVRGIDNYAKDIGRVLVEQNLSIPKPRAQIIADLKSIKMWAEELMVKCEDPKNCAYQYPDLKFQAMAVNDCAKTFSFDIADYISFNFKIPGDNQALQSRVGSLKVAAQPLIQKAITG